MFKSKSLLDYTNLFSLNEYETLILFLFCNKCGSNDGKIFKKEESLEILKILGLINEKWIKVSCTSSFMFNNTSW